MKTRYQVCIHTILRLLKRNKQPMIHDPIEISSIQQFVDVATSRPEGFFINSPWWRGQSENILNSKITATLIPEIYRRSHYHEPSLSNGFIKEAKIRFPKPPADDNLAAWVFLMQHYRCPTKLLDWSTSPFIALFFALESISLNSDGVIWCLDPILLNKIQIDTPSIITYSIDPGFKKALDSVFRSSFIAKEKISDWHQKPNFRDAIFAMNPDIFDIRQFVQRSVFSVHMINTPIEELPECDKFIRKILIRRENKEKLTVDLDKLGYNISTIFPDLESLSHHLKGINMAANFYNLDQNLKILSHS